MRGRPTGRFVPSAGPGFVIAARALLDGLEARFGREELDFGGIEEKEDVDSKIWNKMMRGRKERVRAL